MIGYINFHCAELQIERFVLENQNLLIIDTLYDETNTKNIF